MDNYAKTCNSSFMVNKRDVKVVMAWHGFGVSEFCSYAHVSASTFYKFLHGKPVADASKEKIERAVSDLKQQIKQTG